MNKGDSDTRYILPIVGIFAAIIAIIAAFFLVGAVAGIVVVVAVLLIATWILFRLMSENSD